MKETNVILISAKARHGKDTVAKILKELIEESGKSVLICHFADHLKMLCQNSYNWTPGDKGPVGRTILQNVATIYRNNNPDCWANIVREITLSCPEDYVIIPDCRYRNEPEVFSGMNVYIQGYLAAGIEDALDEESIAIDCDWKEYGKYRDFLPDYGFDFDLLDMIVNHSNEVDLNNCDYSLAD